MSHKPVVPEASTPPYPAHPAPRSDPGPADALDDERDDTPTARKAGSVGSTAFGAAIGIGSAAIVAALLYATRRKA